MVQASCHCGALTLDLDEAPAQVTDCNCSICRRYGVLWAYYAPAQVKVSSGPQTTETYQWGERKIEFHRCRSCGCVSHWSRIGGGNRMGVNARLLPLDVVGKARVRHLDGAVTERYLD